MIVVFKKFQGVKVQQKKHELSEKLLQESTWTQ